MSIKSKKKGRIDMRTSKNVLTEKKVELGLVLKIKRIVLH